MITDTFDRRTIAKMEVALERACLLLPTGSEKHNARRIIASKIIECANRGDATLSRLTEVGYAAAMQLTASGSPSGRKRPPTRNSYFRLICGAAMRHVGFGSCPCKNAKTLIGDRRNYSSKTVFVAQLASEFNFEVELKNIILVAFRFFEFSHSQGHSRRFGRTTATSSLPR